MGRLFATASSEYAEKTLGASMALPLTISAWFNPTDLAANRAMVEVNVGVEAGCQLLIRTTGIIRARQAEASGLADSSSSGSSVSTGVWSHGAAVFASTTSRTVYLNGTAGATATNTIGGDTYTLLTVAARYSASTRGEYFNGAVAEVGVWDVVLTADEITALSKGISPRFIRPASLKAYAPLIGRTSPEIELKGAGLTLSGSAAVDHPRIFLPNSSPVGLPVTGGGSPPADYSGMFFANA